MTRSVESFDEGYHSDWDNGVVNERMAVVVWLRAKAKFSSKNPPDLVGRISADLFEAAAYEIGKGDHRETVQSECTPVGEK